MGAIEPGQRVDVHVGGLGDQPGTVADVDFDGRTVTVDLDIGITLVTGPGWVEPRDSQ